MSSTRTMAIAALLAAACLSAVPAGATSYDDPIPEAEFIPGWSSAPADSLIRVLADEPPSWVSAVAPDGTVIELSREEIPEAPLFAPDDVAGWSFPVTPPDALYGLEVHFRNDDPVVGSVQLSGRTASLTRPVLPGAMAPEDVESRIVELSGARYRIESRLVFWTLPAVTKAGWIAAVYEHDEARAYRWFELHDQPTEAFHRFQPGLEVTRDICPRIVLFDPTHTEVDRRDYECFELSGSRICGTGPGARGGVGGLVVLGVLLSARRK